MLAGCLLFIPNELATAQCGPTVWSLIEQLLEVFCYGNSKPVDGDVDPVRCNPLLASFNLHLRSNRNLRSSFKHIPKDPHQIVEG